ncbi:NDP-glycosyltransferase YjiC-like [Brevipalpus obovatus]|uniref:NDP-glycosyltransferase YjiC-like n=1 Tax=Brevipalpus obovatus TaxID=246614 RepID=UPI003D9EFD98
MINPNYNEGEELTILMASLDAYGHVNSSLGLGQRLSKRGHQVYFANRSGWRKDCERHGLKFIPIEDFDHSMAQHSNNQLMFKYIENYQHNMSKPSIERYTNWSWADLRNNLAYFSEFKRMNNVLRKIVTELKPDLVIGDFTFALPLFKKCVDNIPCIPLMSCNPLELYSPNGAPVASGYSLKDSSKLWEEYRKAERRALWWLRLYLMPWFWRNRVHPPPISQFRCYAKHFGIYVYPECLDYTEIEKTQKNWVRINFSIRESEGREFKIPENLRDKPGNLIYLSMGTLGSANVNLMVKLTTILSTSPYRFIVSKGGHGKHYSLPENMWGEDFVDQLAILPKVDLVITNGGANTILESLHAGKPLIVMPLFYDQLDNAQRIEDRGLGKRIDPFHFEEEQIFATIDEILNSESYAKQVREISGHLRAEDSRTEKVLEMIECLGYTGKSPLSQ